MNRASQPADGFIDLGQINVLVVEDIAGCRTMIVEILRALGVRRVMVAPTCVQAAAACRASRVDLILVDIAMGDGDGLKLIPALRAMPAMRSVPMIVVSAHATEARVIEACAVGADAFVSKPFSVGGLTRRIAEVLSAPRRSARVATPGPAKSTDIEPPRSAALI